MALVTLVVKYGGADLTPNERSYVRASQPEKSATFVVHDGQCLGIRARCRLGSGGTSEAAEGASSEEKGWRRGGICLVVSRPGDRPKSGFQLAATPFGLEGGEELGEGRNL